MLQEEVISKLELGDQATLSQEEGKAYQMLGVERDYGCIWSKIPRKLGDGLVESRGQTGR